MICANSEWQKKLSHSRRRSEARWSASPVERRRDRRRREMRERERKRERERRGRRLNKMISKANIFCFGKSVAGVEFTELQPCTTSLGHAAWLHCRIEVTF